MSSLQHQLRGCESRRRPQFPRPWCSHRVLDTEQNLAFCHTTQRHKSEHPVCAFSHLLIIPYICWDALATRVYTAVLPEDCQLSSPILPLPSSLSAEDAQRLTVHTAPAASNFMGEMKSLSSLASKWEGWLVGL